VDTEKVLLVLVGALGDLACRKFLDAAKSLEERGGYPQVRVLLVDRPWPNQNGDPSRELRLRLGRRLIEIEAEKLVPELVTKPLPWEVEVFRELVRDDGAGQRLDELERHLQRWLSWFQGEGLPAVPGRARTRYFARNDQLMELIKSQYKDWKVVLFVATPPESYPTIVNDWHEMADRIVLEKPAQGLVGPGPVVYPTAERLRAAAMMVEPPRQIATNDHYNAKVTTRAMDLIRDYHLFDYLLQPERIRCIVIQLLEKAQLPLGRYGFYNGAGGAFGDMVPHLLQAVRAILGRKYDIEFEELHFARYQPARREEHLATLNGDPHNLDPNYYQNLWPETETFVAFKARVKVGEVKIPLYCRTGKGFAMERKTLRVDVAYDSSDSAEAEQQPRSEPLLNFIFNFDKPKVVVKDDSPEREFRLETGVLLDDRSQPGVPHVNTNESRGIVVAEYQGIFECLVRGPWEANGLNSRYFPSVPDAADLADKVFGRLVNDRMERARTNSKIGEYELNCGDVDTGPLSWFSGEAKWD
jgi:hypothetical protein